MPTPLDAALCKVSDHLGSAECGSGECRALIGVLASFRGDIGPFEMDTSMFCSERHSTKSITAEFEKCPTQTGSSISPPLASPKLSEGLTGDSSWYTAAADFFEGPRFEMQRREGGNNSSFCEDALGGRGGRFVRSYSRARRFALAVCCFTSSWEFSLRILLVLSCRTYRRNLETRRNNYVISTGYKMLYAQSYWYTFYCLLTVHHEP